ncbi:AGAP006696-PA-like protein [Anopheles sinensis]|uniref:AGAP006696-PA-like protein n=1 Tax=Anopheles sinensis TaxID=74873 RepID=A0A084WCD6_ANOSI|nr:AGAP006696-PA-like protein [Anopheles sinensis]
MEKPTVEIDEAKIEPASEIGGMEDPLSKENIIHTSLNTDIFISAPSIKQVCSWISDGATGNMCVDEMPIEEIKTEPSDDFDPPSEKRSKDMPDKVVESGQSVSSISGTVTHNEQRYRRLRCNYCYLLFYSEKILTKHQMKCQQVIEKVHSARPEPENKIQISNIEDLQKRLPRFTVALIKDDGVNTRKGPGVTSAAQPQNRISVCTTPFTNNVVSFSKLEAQPSPVIATPNLDPLSVETATLPLSLNAVPSGSIPSVSVPLYFPSPVLCPPPSVQPDVTAKLAVQLNRIENEMAKLRKENCRLRETLDMSIDLPTVEKRNGLNVFEFEELDTREQLEQFEEKLGKDAAFSDAMVTRLRKETANCNVETSIARSIDSLFSRQLFVNCSWTGVTPYHPMQMMASHVLINREGYFAKGLVDQ